ncbi:MAG: tRNA (adenosine(37)-N6)-dimethylallyltransferase MiaA, partial [Eggerthellaceae bacterium]|nr:tRNA (adenosine(37)-N6)-dimethylallyltransferase MiaA [Eggerthellaceae bacterium]
VALYQEYVHKVFGEIEASNKRIVLVGGTGLYIRAAIDDYDFPSGEQIDNPIRAQYMQFAQDKGNMALWELLHDFDPKSAEVIHPNNVRRVVRAFELLDEGKHYYEQLENLQNIPQNYPCTFIGLYVNPETLNKRIDERVDKMIESGLIEEVKSLLDKGYRESLTSQQAIGYKEIVSYLDGNCDLDEAIELIKIATHRYAKRQRSWFNKDKRIKWFDVTSLKSTADYVFVDEVISYIESVDTIDPERS